MSRYSGWLFAHCRASTHEANAVASLQSINQSVNQSINQSITLFFDSTVTQVDKERNTWQAARTSNSRTKLATVKKTERRTDVVRIIKLQRNNFVCSHRHEYGVSSIADQKQVCDLKKPLEVTSARCTGTILHIVCIRCISFVNLGPYVSRLSDTPLHFRAGSFAFSLLAQVVLLTRTEMFNGVLANFELELEHARKSSSVPLISVPLPSHLPIALPSRPSPSLPL